MDFATLFAWGKNPRNWLKLGVAGVVIALNYILVWDFSTEHVITFGAAMAIPEEMWEFVISVFKKFFVKDA